MNTDQEPKNNHIRTIYENRNFLIGPHNSLPSSRPPTLHHRNTIEE